MRINGTIEIADAVIADFCKRWKITKIEAFGSALRDDFRPDSDIDLLVTFEKDARISVFDIGRMQLQMEEMVGRPVDLVERASIEQSRNPFRRQSILTTAKVVFPIV
jgi:predicted nucleotidyltransferase